LGSLLKLPRSCPVFGRAGPAAPGAAGVLLSELGGPGLLDPEVGVPTGVKVVLVAEPPPWPKAQIPPAHRAGGVAEPRPTPGVHAVLGAVNVEPVEVFAAPAEYRLYDCVQFGDRGLVRHEQAPPDQRADPVDHRP